MEVSNGGPCTHQRSDHEVGTIGGLELVLFENDRLRAREYMGAGISSFMVDLEVLGKDLRQLGFDTEINPGTWSDLASVALEAGARTWCRINRFGAHTRGEVESAIGAGGRVVMLPMVTRLEEVDGFLELVDARCATGIMIETVQGARLAASLNGYPIQYVFFGMNDFAISRGGGSIFRALTDGSVEEVRNALPDVRFGFGGLTDVSRGHPVPCSRLLEEMSRLRCDFTFLRRSFRRDAQQIPPGRIVDGIRACWHRCEMRTESERNKDREELVKLVDELSR